MQPPPQQAPYGYPQTQNNDPYGQNQNPLYGPPSQYAQPQMMMMAMPPTPMAMGGARPFFQGPLRAERHIRGIPSGNCLMDREPSQYVPPRWYDGGEGWVTKYFIDVRPYDRNALEPGHHRCIVVSPQTGQQCGYEVDGDDCCKCCSCCWQPMGAAPPTMAGHLTSAHGIPPPPKFQWSSGLCDCDGACCEAYWCFPCQASRQMMASYGHADHFDCLWCFLFTLLMIPCPKKGENGGGNDSSGLGCLGALFPRILIADLNNIDEGRCCAVLTACCCPVCSLAQTHREFSAAGVYPGGFCCVSPPAGMHPMAMQTGVPMQQPVKKV